MSQESRLGFVAVAIVAGLSMAVAGIVLLASSHGPPATTDTPPAAQVGAGREIGPEADPMARIVAHPFWRVPVTRDQIERLVETVQAQQAGAYVYLDDEAHVVVEAPAYVGPSASERGLTGKKWFRFVLSDWQKRPTRSEVLAHALTAMDQADFGAR